MAAKAIAAAEANRQFSDMLRQVRNGTAYTITAHGRPVARIVPIRSSDTLKVKGREALLKRLRRTPIADVGRWTRDELYRRMNVALDTTILAYAEGVNGPDRKRAALELVERLTPDTTLLPVQTLGELFNVLVKKAGRAPAAARDAVLSWGDAFPLIETSNDVVAAACDLSADHRLSMWDAVIVAAAADASCRLLLSEDLQDGFTWSGVTVVHPFAATRHPLLEALIG